MASKKSGSTMGLEPISIAFPDFTTQLLKNISGQSLDIVLELLQEGYLNSIKNSTLMAETLKEMGKMGKSAPEAVIDFIFNILEGCGGDDQLEIQAMTSLNGIITEERHRNKLTGYALSYLRRKTKDENQITIIKILRDIHPF